MRPSVLAVLRLIISSNFVGCSTERSGLSAVHDLVDVARGSLWYTGLAAWPLIVLACVSLLAALINDRSVARRGYK